VIEIADVFIWNGSAYLPVNGKTEVGFFWPMGPVLRSALDIDAVTEALAKIVAIGNPAMKHPTQTEFRLLTPVEKALGIRGWKKMAKIGVIRCVIWWTRDAIMVAFSPQGTNDVMEIDFANQHKLSLDAPARSIAEILLQEVHRRQGG
jgi:hypothetical protein